MSRLGALWALAGVASLAVCAQNWKDPDERYRPRVLSFPNDNTFFFSPVERYHLGLSDYFNTSTCLEKNVCQDGVREAFLFAVMKKLQSLEGMNPFDLNDFRVKVVLKGIVNKKAMETRLVEKRSSLFMDCIFERNASSEFVAKYLNETLSELNEVIREYSAAAKEPIEVIGVRKLDFVETFTWIEVLAGSLVILIILVVVLSVGGGAACGVTKIVNNAIKKSHAMWTPADVHEPPSYHLSTEQTRPVNMMNANADHIDVSVTRLLLEGRPESPVMTREPVQLTTFRPIDEDE